MADQLRIGLAQLLRKAHMDHDADFLKEGVRALSQALMEMEVEAHIGAGRHERVEGRSGHRNGYRERTWETRAGAIELKVHRVRDGSYFPSLLEPRRRAERALSAVVQEAYVHGVEGFGHEVGRGLGGVRLVTSDAHRGLKGAVE